MRRRIDLVNFLQPASYCSPACEYLRAAYQNMNLAEQNKKATKIGAINKLIYTFAPQFKNEVP